MYYEMKSFQGGWLMMARRWLLIILCGVIVLTLATRLVFREFDFGTSLPVGFPSDVPIVLGTITSCKTARSDDLVRVVEVHIQSYLSFQDVVQFYRNAFATGATEHWNVCLLYTSPSPRD